ncbi:MAG: FimV/HubP family polar landmark protein [Pseudomonadota bacterium]
MGQQIAPAHELFSGAVVSGGSGDLDLSFDETRALEAADIDAAIEPPSGNTGTFEEVFSGDGDTGTVEQLADMSGIDFEFDETLASSNESNDATEEAPIDFGEDDASIDFSLDGLDDELETSAGGDTVEQPVDLDDLDTDIENTAEREGIDLSSMSVLDESTEAMTATTGDATAEIGADLLDATGVTSVLPDDFKVDLPSEPADVSGDAETLLADTSGLVLDDLDLDAGESADSTNIMPLANNDGGVDLDVADLTSELRVDDISEATQELPVGNGDATLFSDEVFAGDADSDADTGLNLALDDTAETNVAEVGTKLDLARAYVDMGDPEGARSILKEVLNEGDDSQQAEAQKLLEALGA